MKSSRASLQRRSQEAEQGHDTIFRSERIRRQDQSEHAQDQRRQQRGQGDVTGDRNDDEPGQECPQGRHWHQHRDHTGARGHALTATEAEENRKEMAQERGQARQHP